MKFLVESLQCIAVYLLVSIPICVLFHICNPYGSTSILIAAIEGPIIIAIGGAVIFLCFFLCIFVLRVVLIGLIGAFGALGAEIRKSVDKHK